MLFKQGENARSYNKFDYIKDSQALSSHFINCGRWVWKDTGHGSMAIPFGSVVSCFGWWTLELALQCCRHLCTLASRNATGPHMHEANDSVPRYFSEAYRWRRTRLRNWERRNLLRKYERRWPNNFLSSSRHRNRIQNRHAAHTEK